MLFQKGGEIYSDIKNNINLSGKGQHIGHIRLDKITARDIQKFIISMTEEKRCDGRNKRNGKLSAKTIKLHISMISTIFDYAIKMQLIQNNPCRSVTLPKPDGEKRDVYTLEEVQQLFELF